MNWKRILPEVVAVKNGLPVNVRVDAVLEEVIKWRGDRYRDRCAGLVARRDP
jgi:hypothetical protein